MSKSNDNDPTAPGWRRYRRRRHPIVDERNAGNTPDAPPEDAASPGLDISEIERRLREVDERSRQPEPEQRPEPEQQPLRDIVLDGKEILVDANLAARILSEWFYERQPQRQDSPPVTAIREEMAAGQWWGGRHLGFGRLPDDDTRMIDGYKRLLALQGLPDITIAFTPKFYGVADEAELHRLWQSFEPGTPRTLRQELRASGAVTAFGLHTRLAESLLACIPYAASGFRNPTFSQPHLVFKHAARQRYAEHLWPLLARYQSAIAPATGTLKTALISGGFLAPAMYVAENGDADQMLRFVGEIATQSHVNPDHPSRRLGLFAVNKTLHADIVRRLRKIDRRRVLTRAWALTWNQYEAGAESMGPITIRIDHPISLAGTPLVTADFNRRQVARRKASQP